MKPAVLLFPFTLLLLVLLTVSWRLHPQPSTLQWLLEITPLLLVLPGLRKQERRPRQWLGFILLFLMTVAILQAFNPQPILRMLGITLFLLTLSEFVLLLLSMKVRQSIPKE